MQFREENKFEGKQKLLSDSFAKFYNCFFGQRMDIISMASLDFLFQPGTSPLQSFLKFRITSVVF